MKAANFLVIMSDEHNPKLMGCAGHPFIKTPNLDKLAAGGTRFSGAYTPSPICVPARASFATGEYVNKIRYWDNALSYEGLIPSWGHRLIAKGHRSVSVGKLHYRNEVDPTGFDQEIVPLHVVDGLGDLMGMVRTPPPKRVKARKQVEDAKMGDSTYTKYDATIRDEAIQWLKTEAPKADKPWVLFVSFVCPHFPLVAPEQFFSLYPVDEMPLPVQYGGDGPKVHPYVEQRWKTCGYSLGFSERQIKLALAAYCGMVSYLDDNIGQLLKGLQDSGLADNTRVLYTSDHGDNLGRNELWGKSTMYEDAAGVPLILSGADVPQGKTVSTPANLVDVFPTVMQCVGEPQWPQDKALPGVSLFDLAQGQNPRRAILSEYHASGSSAGVFMTRHEQYKYVHYIDAPPQLFDLAADPDETTNLAGDAKHRDALQACEQALRSVVNPEEAERVAKNDQAQRIQDMGGKDALVKRGSFGYTPAPGEAVHLG